MELLGNKDMTEEDAKRLNGGSPEDGDLQDHIAHWVETLDRWVKRIDQGMGRREGEVEDLNGHGAADPARPVVDEAGADRTTGVA